MVNWKTIILLLIPFFISAKCDRVSTKLTCAQIRASHIDNLPLCDISFVKNRCRCRCFNLTNHTVVEDNNCTWTDGEEFRSGDYELEVCEGISGFFIDDWAKEVMPKTKKLKRIFNNLCGE